MASPPTGTVTFLFTDIEGSTKMWEHNAPAMQATLARHDELLRWAIEQRGGYVFKTVGDAFCCAFPTTPMRLRRPWRPSARSSPQNGKRQVPSG